MGRHEIRLRRQRMTSRRIEGHKNYYDLLKKHEKHSSGRKVMRIIIYIIIFLGLVLLAYFSIQKFNNKKDTAPDQQAASVEAGKDKDLPMFHLNTIDYGKT